MAQVGTEDRQALLAARQALPAANARALQAAATLRQRLADEDQQREQGILGACTLHVCTSFRAPGAPREPREERPGYVLYRELEAVLRASSLSDRVEVRAVQCLSL
ncbi:MAG: hypothetical protein AAGA68_21555 [Pseudomonadota bacterium]